MGGVCVCVCVCVCVLKGAGHSSWGMSLLYSPLCWLRIKVTFLFPPNSLWIFYSSSVGRESQDFGHQHTLSLSLLMVFPGWPSWGPFLRPPTLHTVSDPSSCCIVCFLVLIIGQLTCYIYNQQLHVFSTYLLYGPPLPLKKKKKKRSPLESTFHEGRGVFCLSCVHPNENGSPQSQSKGGTGPEQNGLVLSL